MARRRSTESDDSSLFDASASPESGSGSGGNGDATAVSARGPSGDGVSPVALHTAAQERYLNYALSVITSRALPDVRDGLKPVQRRILFTMWQQGLTFDVKHRKCAKVVGDVMGNYHPHGDTAIYDTLVRMAQAFSLRYPLVDGSGNFGSLDGDAAAAMRYTECRLARISDEMLSELEQQTVALRPNYDGTKTEPVVLPARLPNLLINGAMGIAVGMATNIPPHNVGEVCAALEKLLEAILKDENISSRALCRWVKGPDFPTGGQIISSQEEIKQVYETGSGSIRTRGTFELGPTTRSNQTVYITSIPYGVNKAELVEQIAGVVLGRKLPPLVDVKDVSTDDVRIELTLKRDTDVAMVMAYLFRHTNLQSNFAVNLTCLVPTKNPLVGQPDRLDLKTILWHFLHFRLQVVTRRLEHELGALLKRIHLLEGFEKVFDALDEIIKIIRKSEGKADAAEKIIKRFELDAEQTDAILELKLYRLARLEILIIQKELEEKRKRARELKRLLAADNETDRWQIVRGEIQEMAKKYGDKRRTIVESVEDEPEYNPEDFIIEEDNVVIVTRDGWIKRQKEIKDLSSTRLREGDSVLDVLPGSTRATVVFFTNHGVAYSCRIIDVPASTGHGDPIQKLFKLKDGERVVAAMSLDPRVAGEIKSPGQNKDGTPKAPPTHAVAVTSDGYALRFSVEGFIEPSTRAGRKYARPAKDSEVVGVAKVHGSEIVIAATREARATLCKVDEINFLAGPGKGVILIKLKKAPGSPGTSGGQDQVLGFIAAGNDRDTLTMETSQSAQRRINTGTYQVTGRGGKGREILQRGQFVRVVHEADEPTVPALLDEQE
ncbi:MAG: DNA topoisomerase IV subunit A [Phycisphaeraceae bacterium]